MQRKHHFFLFTLLSTSAYIACTAPDPGVGTTTSGSTTATTATTATTSTSGDVTTTTTAGTTNGTTTATTGLDITTGMTTDDGDTGPRMEECEYDAAGNPVLDPNGVHICTCISIATWGALGTYGAVPGMDGQDAVVAWLNANSTGDAEYFPTKPVVTEDYLKAFDVILIQDISKWAAFSAEESAAFEAWVRAGGGVITLNGYSADGNEMANVNGLLAFAGLSYVPSSDTANEMQRMTKLGTCADCYGSAVPQAGWVATHPISANMQQVGAFHGRAVMGGTPVAEEFGAVLGATAEVELGRVFMFHDEWVTYNSQWTGTGLPTDCRDPNYSANGLCSLEHPIEQYTIPQFWFNSILWTSGDPECFVIEDDTIIR